jgi:N-acyl homoserine lactone hydrolase
VRRGRGVALAAAGAAALLAKACASPPPVLPTPDGAQAVITRTFDDVTVHAVRTGWVRVKEAHRTLRGPDALRTPAILLGRAWTEWMPVTVYVVVHPEGVFLVDAGLSEETLQSAHFDCDPGTHFVYDTLLKFLFTPQDRIDRQLAALGLSPEALRAVVFTHRHADHTDALGALPASATAYVGARDWPTHNGALACRWPAQRIPTLVDTRGLRSEPSRTARRSRAMGGWRWCR